MPLKLMDMATLPPVEQRHNTENECNMATLPPVEQKHNTENECKNKTWHIISFVYNMFILRRKYTPVFIATNISNTLCQVMGVSTQKLNLQLYRK